MAWEPLPGQIDHTRALSAVLDRLHHTLGLARPDAVTALQQHWSSMLGADLANRCHLESLRHQTLVVVVSDPAVAEHLRWSSSEILGAANAICGGEVATELQVRIRRDLG